MNIWVKTLLWIGYAGGVIAIIVITLPLEFLVLVGWVLGTLVIMLVIITIDSFQADSQKPRSRAWLKWIAPMGVALPVTCYWVHTSYFIPIYIFTGIALGVFLYVFGLLVIAFVETLSKPRLPLIKGKVRGKNDKEYSNSS